MIPSAHIAVNMIGRRNHTLPSKLVCVTCVISCWLSFVIVVLLVPPNLASTPPINDSLRQSAGSRLVKSNPIAINRAMDMSVGSNTNYHDSFC